MKIDSRYGDMDADTKMFLRWFAEPLESLILEVGANQEYSACILTDNGYRVLGVDLQDFYTPQPINYHRIKGEFVKFAQDGVFQSLDCIYSTSAIEHFGLGTYPGCPCLKDHDVTAMEMIWRILRPNGTCYLTVPYGREHIEHGRDWRVYSKQSLQERLIQKFNVEKKLFFKSAGCNVPDDGSPLPMVKEEDADAYDGNSCPHLTVFVKLRK